MIARLVKRSEPLVAGQLAAYYELEPAHLGHGAVWISAVPFTSPIVQAIDAIMLGDANAGGPETIVFALLDNGEPDYTLGHELVKVREFSHAAALCAIGYEVSP